VQNSAVYDISMLYLHKAKFHYVIQLASWLAS